MTGDNPRLKDAEPIPFSALRKNSLGKISAARTDWASLKKQFRTARVSQYSRKQYEALSVEEKNAEKALAGAVVGAVFEGNKRRLDSIKESRLIFLDIDDCDDAWSQKLQNANHPLGKYEHFIHETRSSRPNARRYRMCFPIKQTLTGAAEIELASRLLGWKLDPTMELVDSVSYRPAQLMFRPSRSRDQTIFFGETTGPFVNFDRLKAEARLAEINLDDYLSWPRAPAEKRTHDRKAKLDDPATKPGMVGVFCSAFDVPAAIETFLSDTYTVGMNELGEMRGTYLKGSAANGVLVVDNGAHLLSFHSSDPCGDLCVNAFDMVRLHLFGDQDAEISPTTPITKKPSYLAMLEWCQTNPDVRKAIVEAEEDRKQAILDLLEEEPDDDPSTEGWGIIGQGPAKKAKRSAKQTEADRAEIHKLPRDARGSFLPTARNIETLLLHEEYLRGTLFFCELNQEPRVRYHKSMKTGKGPQHQFEPGRREKAFDDQTLYQIHKYLQDEVPREGLAIKSIDKGVLAAAMVAAALADRVHPVKEFILSQVWDGVPRLDTVLQRYFGVPLSDYSIGVVRYFYFSYVARVFHPGCEVHAMIVLEGPQGAGKTSFLKNTAGFHDCESLCNVLNVESLDPKLVMEATAGKTIIEIAELSESRSNSVEKIKAVVSAADDAARMAYGRHTTKRQRAFIFAATTNNAEYFKDTTGNRRFLPVRVAAGVFDGAKYLDERGQILAEAYARYREFFVEQQSGRGSVEWPRELYEAAAAEQNLRLMPDIADRRDVLRNELDTPRVLSWFTGREPAAGEDEALGRIVAIRAKRAAELMGLDPKSSYALRDAAATLSQLGWVKSARRINGEGGGAAGYWRPGFETAGTSYGFVPVKPGAEIL